MNHPGSDTSSKWRSATALFALVAAMGVWSSPAAAADPHSPAPAKPGASPQLEDSDSGDDATEADDQSSADSPHGDIRNPYVSGPLAGIGGPNTGDNSQQDLGQTVDDILGGVTQDGDTGGIGQTVNDILGGVAQGGGTDGIGQVITGVLETGSGVIGSGASGNKDGSQVPDAVRKGVIQLNKALGDTGYNSDPDSHGAGGKTKSEGSPASEDDEN